MKNPFETAAQVDSRLERVLLRSWWLVAAALLLGIVVFGNGFTRDVLSVLVALLAVPALWLSPLWLVGFGITAVRRRSQMQRSLWWKAGVLTTFALCFMWAAS